jgi:hypothetical protein
MKIFDLVETSSKQLAQSKPEMEALLHQWRALAQQGISQDLDYLTALSLAINTLEISENIPEFLENLKKLEVFASK